MQITLRLGLALLLLGMPAAAAGNDLAEADARYAAGGLDNLAVALDLYAQARQAMPADYETLWKSARAHRDYGNRAKQDQIADWEDVCEEQGKIAMRLAEQAIALAPENVEGHYYYGLSVGIYSDGVSIFTALSEGLKGKTQNSFEKAYAFDKTFNRAGPVLSLGRFWTVLPWPMHDRQKALQYFREYEQTGFLASSAEGQVYFGELLIKLGGAENQTEARRWLESAAQSPEPYFAEWAKRLLAELD
jgi:tetratricopeptide (TPR) repeat protein